MGQNDRRRLVLASNNSHKLQEIQSILGSSWEVLGAQAVAPGVNWDETGTTFLENARIKIHALRPFTQGCIMADDSGLCVDALAGEPGVGSSGYGGVEGDHARNVERLLAALGDTPQERRTAYFYCLILFLDEQGGEHRFEGRCRGRIAFHPRGRGGFGYDPVFIPDGQTISMAEMGEREKNAVSHRGRALAEFSKFVT